MTKAHNNGIKIYNERKRKQEDEEIMLYEEKVIETIPVGLLG